MIDSEINNAVVLPIFNDFEDEKLQALIDAINIRLEIIQNKFELGFGTLSTQDTVNYNFDVTSIPDEIYQIFYQSSAPSSQGEETGDYWIDSDNNKIYRYDGASWGEIQDNDIASAISDAATAQSTADGKIYVWAQDSVPTSDAIGDLWIDTNDDNKLYRAASAGADEITAGEWELVRDSGIAQAISDAAGAQATADGKVTTFYQDGEPTAEGEGDLWVDTNDGNKLYRWNGASWVEVQDNDIAQAIANASTAQSTADGKIVSFYQDAEPSGAGESEGDIWFDTDDDNKPYRYTSGVWEAAEFDVATWSKIVGAGKPDNNADVTANNHQDVSWLNDAGAMALLDEIDVGDLSATALGRLFTDSIIQGIVEAWQHGSDSTIDGGSIENSTVTAAKITTASLAAIVATLGAVEAGYIADSIASPTMKVDLVNNVIWMDKTTYSDTTAGIWIGDDSGTYKVNIGDDTYYIKWNGTVLQISAIPPDSVAGTDQVYTRAEKYNSAISETLIYSLTVNRPGEIRVSCEIWNNGGGGDTTYLRVKRGSSTLMTFSTTATSPTAKSADLAGWEVGDVMNIYLWGSNGGVINNVQYFMLKIVTTSESDYYETIT